MRDKILIIGGNGYIGHEVQKKLNLYYDLKSCDILLYSKTKDKKK